MFRKQLVLIGLCIALTACSRPWTEVFLVTPIPQWTPEQATPLPTKVSTPTLAYNLPPTNPPGSTLQSPTPDPPHSMAGNRTSAQSYFVQSGDTLGGIAQRFNVSIEELTQANNITDPNSLEIGQLLTIPAVTPQPTGPAEKIIPDSELVYGPMSASFDIKAFIISKGGYLAGYSQDVNGVTMDGAQVVQLIAQDYSINPRLLLALLEYRSGWVSKQTPDPNLEENPFGYINDWYTGLYRQLAWASIQLNSGFYRWWSNDGTDWVLEDGSVVPIDPTINAGTAGVQNLFAQFDDYTTWLRDVTPGGFPDSYIRLFGNPFALAIEPLVPVNLVQPSLLLPFGPDETWSFTGGPHLAWDAGTPFGALDFAPPGEAEGCVESDAWVTAVADGLVTRTGVGVVILDLDGDGNEGSGWVVVYMHIESRDRVSPGTYLHAGDRVGHPSCEGGVSTGTHVHLARKFNGVWIAADGSVPFNLSGWVASGTGEEYVGTLTLGGVVVEAYGGNGTDNKIQR
jgi:LasA protease